MRKVKVIQNHLKIYTRTPNSWSDISGVAKGGPRGPWPPPIAEGLLGGPEGPLRPATHTPRPRSIRLRVYRPTLNIYQFGLNHIYVYRQN